MRDVFSKLPDDVIIRILSCLPTLDSVRTMLLRRFGDLWTLVPKLDFRSFNVRRQQRFMLFVRHVMMLHRAPVIDSFMLQFYDGYCWDSEKDVVDEIQTWIKCALRKEPKFVFLHFSGEGYFPLPHSFFLNQSLVDLTLEGCRLKQRKHKRVHMASLRSLSLNDVIMDGNEEKRIEIFNEVISGCPSLEILMSACDVYDMVIHSKVLQKLVLEDEGFATNDFFVKVSCPNVKILHLGCSHFPCYELSDISSVCEATIHCFCRRENFYEVHEDIQLLLKGLRNVEFLTLDGLPLGDKLWPHNRWKVVTLRGTISSEPCIVWVYDLVRHSPILEKLTIMMEPGYEIEWDGDGICPQLSSPCIAPCLREVHIAVGMNYDDQAVLELVEFFLKAAVMLVELVISPNCEGGERSTERLTRRKKNNLLKRISRFTKACSNTRITIKD